MNYRSKTTAMVLCFLFGLLGAHWFYLGRPGWGFFYLIVALVTGPLGFCTLVLGGTLLDGHPLPLVLILLLMCLLQVAVALMAFYDFCCLLCIHPARFDLEYNR